MGSTRHALASAWAKAGPLAKRRASPGAPRLQTPEPAAPPPPEPRTKLRIGSLTSKTFWSLMDRWAVGDQAALALLDEPRGLGPGGRRPRFRLSTEQMRRLEYLLDIDANLSASWGPRDAGKWLARPNPALAFGHSPLEHMTRGGLPGIAEVLRFLHHWGLKQSLRLGASP